VAVDPDAKGHGVLIVVNDVIHGARSLLKSNTTSVATFISSFRGPIGTVNYGKTHYCRKPYTKHTFESEFSVDGLTELPRVDIIYIYEDIPGDPIEYAANAGAKGIVTAGVGNGNLTDAAVDALAEASKNGVICVRSSRVVTGSVGRNIELDDDALGFVASYELTPHKARVLLRLALLKTQDPVKIQAYFAEY